MNGTDEVFDSDDTMLTWNPDYYYQALTDQVTSYHSHTRAALNHLGLSSKVHTP